MAKTQKQPAKPKAFEVRVEEKKRKVRAPKTAFKEGNEHRWEPGGPSPNPGGKPQQHRLITKALRTYLSDRAPDDICRQMKLPSRSSWAQVIARRLMLAAVNDLEYLKLLMSYHEGMPKQSIEFEDISEDGEGPPLITVNFVSSQYTAEHPEEIAATVVETPPDHMPPPLIEARVPIVSRDEPEQAEADEPPPPLVALEPVKPHAYDAAMARFHRRR